jgi:peptidoglycan glycosyltransferase
MSQARGTLSKIETQAGPLPGREVEKAVPIDPESLNLDPANLSDRFVLERGGVPLIVESSLDSGLQDYIIHLLQNSQNLQAAAVVMRPDDGRILAMASFDKDQNSGDLCLKADFPAASLFKIVSAAAAFEFAGFTPEKTVYFNGRKHTLYKSQLKQRRGKYTSKISFKRAFASSINPVFGKLGIYDLGQKVMSDSAEKFLFNQSIPFDLPVAESFVHVPDDDFGLAEIATGFNKSTTISPLHAALLASAVANDGVMMRPWLVKKISQENGEILYQTRPAKVTRSISRNTAAKLRILMKDTIVNGTCRKSFRRLRRKKAFKNVELGAKTGTINDKTDQFKYDWFTAYVLPPNGAKGISIAILGIHGKRLGIRANKLGSNIINHYFTSS